MDAFFDMIIEFATTAGIKILMAIILLIVGIKLIRLFLRLLSRMERFSQIDASAQSFLRSFLGIALKITLFMTIGAVLGVPMTSVIALLASAGLAIGLALQGALGNLAGGLMILMFKPFKVGDVIDTRTDMGVVIDINIFYTILRTFDNRHITLPNGSLTNAAIINYSVEEQRRVDWTFTTGYGANINQVKQILLDIVNEHDLTLAEPEPFCRLKEHGDSALAFALRVWCNAPDYWTIYFDVNEKVKEIFDAKGIEIPYPQLDVHLKNEQTAAR